MEEGGHGAGPSNWRFLARACNRWLGTWEAGQGANNHWPQWTGQPNRLEGTCGTWPSVLPSSAESACQALASALKQMCQGCWWRNRAPDHGKPLTFSSIISKAELLKMLTSPISQGYKAKAAALRHLITSPLLRGRCHYWACWKQQIWGPGCHVCQWAHRHGIRATV